MGHLTPELNLCCFFCNSLNEKRSQPHLWQFHGTRYADLSALKIHQNSRVAGTVQIRFMGGLVSNSSSYAFFVIVTLIDAVAYIKNLLVYLVWFALNRRIVLPLVFVLVVMLFLGVESASAEGNVGVTVGQTREYTYAFSGTHRDVNGSLISSMPFNVGYIETLTIQEISGTNITVQCVRRQLDGTEETNQWWVDVNTGNGTASGVVISPNRNEGEIVYANQNSEGAYIINETILLKCGDTSIPVNHASLTYTVDEQPTYWDYYWEKETGLLIKYTIIGTEVEDDGSVRYLSYHFQRVDLQQVFHPLIDSADYPVTVDSNSAIVGFEFNQTERQLSLNVTGLTGTSGFCDVMVPDSLVWGTFSLSMDGYALVEGDDYSQTHNGTHYTFHISYIHSDHTIEIVGSDAIPEFPAFLILPLFMTATSLAIILYRKRLRSIPTL